MQVDKPNHLARSTYFIARVIICIGCLNLTQWSTILKLWQIGRNNFPLIVAHRNFDTSDDATIQLRNFVYITHSYSEELLNDGRWVRSRAMKMLLFLNDLCPRENSRALWCEVSSILKSLFGIFLVVGRELEKRSPTVAPFLHLQRSLPSRCRCLHRSSEDICERRMTKWSHKCP